MSAVKTLLSPLILTVPLWLGLSACSSGPGEDKFAPEINEIYTDIAHRHPSFYAKWPDDRQATIDFTFLISVSDPQGVGDLFKLQVIDLNDSRTYTLFHANENNPYSNCYQGAGIFECRFARGTQFDYSNLKNFEVVIQDLSGYTRRKTFNLLLADGAQPEQESFVYSAEFTRDKTNGYAALEAMTIEDNGMLFATDDQSFHIEFVAKDSRAKHYSLDFYDNESPANHVGFVPLNSNSITGNPITTGETTTLELHWSEIDFKGDFSVNDIKNMHITLYDEAIPFVIADSDLGDWFNLQATSQAIPLTE